MKPDLQPDAVLSAASPPLRDLIARLWGGEAGGAVRVTLGEPPAGHRVVESYAVVPDPGNARFLVPLTGRAAAAASLTRYNRLRSGKIRITRALLGAGFRIGLAQRMIPHRLLVSTPAELPPGDLPGTLLGAHLRQVLNVPELAFGLGVRPADPNGKPTLQLFSAAGEPLGYAKIGWSPATRDLVVNEATAGRAAAAAASERLRIPAVLHHGPWHDRVITVTAPLPAAVTRHADPDRPPDPSVLAGIAETSGLRPLRLAESGHWRRLRDLVADMDDEPALAKALSTALDALQAEHGGTELRFGRWHGDWVPWNIGHHRGATHVWDWEHSTADAPLGLDLLHWRFQVALVLRGGSLDTAAAAVERAARDELGALDVPGHASGLMARLYLLEMFTRAYRLKRGGGGWNPSLYPAMLRVLERWEEDS